MNLRQWRAQNALEFLLWKDRAPKMSESAAVAIFKRALDLEFKSYVETRAYVMSMGAWLAPDPAMISDFHIDGGMAGYKGLDGCARKLNLAQALGVRP